MKALKIPPINACLLPVATLALAGQPSIAKLWKRVAGGYPLFETVRSALDRLRCAPANLSARLTMEGKSPRTIAPQISGSLATLPSSRRKLPLAEPKRVTGLTSLARKPAG
jgi:hypothetical protein